MFTQESTPTQVMGVLKRLKAYAVDWSHVSSRNTATEDVQYEPGIDREEAELAYANVVSSELNPTPRTFFDQVPQHMLAIDLDVPAYLVPSSTPGHSHLYVDVRIPHHRYMALLSMLADCGVIERGYAEVSIARGHSDLRLPWVRKGEPSPPKPPAPTKPIPGVSL